MKRLATLLLILSMASPSFAGEEKGFWTKQSIIVGTAMSLAAAADVESTLDMRARGFREMNPLWEPISEKRGALYGMKTLFVTGAWVWSEKLRRSPHRSMRLIGWFLTLEMTLGVGLIAIRNWRLGK